MIEYYQYDQVRENSTNAVAIVAPSASFRQMQVYLKIANVTEDGASVRLFHDNSGSTYDETTAIIWDLEIAPGTMLEVDHIFMRGSSSRLAYRSSVANALTVTIYAIVDLI